MSERSAEAAENVRVRHLERSVAELREMLEGALHELNYREVSALKGAAEFDVLESLLGQARWIRATSDGWLKVQTSSGSAISLPSGLALDYSKTEGGRDYFKILEGIRKGLMASAASGYLDAENPQRGSSRIRFEPRGGGPLEVGSMVYDKQISVTAGGTTTGPHPALTDPANPLPPGSYEVEIPDYPHPADPSYGAYRTVWFRIGHSGDRYVHPGRVSAGCITCEPTNWPQIYRALATSRQDARSVGLLTVA